MVHVLDTEDCSLSHTMIYPTSSTSKNDMGLEHTTGSRVVRVVDGGCFSDLGTNSIIFEMYSSEGFWPFQGPQDLSDYDCFGSEFANTDHVACFPTQTVCYHSRFANAPGQNNTVRVKKMCKRGSGGAGVTDRPGPSRWATVAIRSKGVIIIDFSTIKSSPVPLIQGLCAQICFRSEISVVLLTCSSFL